MRYPAIIAGCVIYGSYVLSSLSFYHDFKHRTVGIVQILTYFDGLFWIWLLSYALVSMIELRERILRLQSRTDLDALQREREQLKIRTMHELSLTLHHELNNPLAIIYLHLHVLKRQQLEQGMPTGNIEEIEKASKRIHAVVLDLCSSMCYSTVSSPVGDLVCVRNDRSPMETPEVTA